MPCARSLRSASMSASSFEALRSLDRATALPSSHAGDGGNRNSIGDHRESLRVVAESQSGTLKITLVDDAIVQGTQLAGAYDVLHAAGYRDIMAVTGGCVGSHEGPWRQAPTNVVSEISWARRWDRATRHLK